ncbi:4'-phosphopantetheinyl transferase superfamily protein [Salegentibacter sp. F188]|uniref:4'-phosphopantetheinyl transferase superfamily protein n=1 Tax=Autumnicola patrickiae TaxID=3075591 RepID=A0ABU3E4I6_9FLAO|nr:4'-phosphopantetheinyl transferase superfamily protein [Salegentibacter sp. F188]MDT0690162.1 4'-phosphopantetheinyl transferase superfamily protein [Salegentibacter sp. F188]
MIGNDIVDLKLAAKESNWKRPRLHSKIFSETEQEILQHSKNPEQCFWLLWTMKEAAYKAHQRRFSLPRKFNPKSFGCSLNTSEGSASSGVVEVDNWHYCITAHISEKVIHCVASAENPEVKTKLITEHKNLNRELIFAISSQTKLSSEDLVIAKDEKYIPHLFFNGKNYNMPFSLSHHGDYSAYAFAVNSLLKTS